MKSKKIVALLLSIIMLFSSSLTVYGIFQQNGFNYEYIDNSNTVEIMSLTTNGELSGATSITIPATLNGGLVTNIGMSAFYSNKIITEIKFPNTLNVISNSAFYGATSLQTITLPKELKYLGRASFSYCIGLSSVVFDTQKLSVIEPSAFFGCTNLNNVILPTSLFSIDDYAFANCTNLTNIYIPSNVAVISDNAFNGVKNLTIYGSKDSNAYNYAVKNNISFVSIDDIVRTSLNDWIDTVLYKLNGESSLYLEDTIENLREKYNTAVAIQDNFFSLQSEVDNAVTELKNAYYSLKLKSMTKLEEKVLEAESYINKSDLYTETSINNLKTAIDSANEIINKLVPTQREVSAAINTINARINSLVFQSEEDLRNIIELSKDILENNPYKYTTESINDLQTAYDSALPLLADGAIPTNEELTEADTNVRNAYNALLELMKGDINSDRKVTIKDAVIIQKYILGIKEFDQRNCYTADFNDDGKVSIADIVLVQRYILGA